MTAAETIAETKADGIEFTTPFVGDGTESDPYRPSIFDAEPDGHFHFDVDASDDPATAGAKATVWVSKPRTPGPPVTAIRDETTNSVTVLQETG